MLKRLAGRRDTLSDVPEPAPQAGDLRWALQWSQRLHASLQIEEVLRLAVEGLAGHFGVQHVQVFLLNRARDALELRAASGEQGQALVAAGLSLPLAGASPAARAMAQGKAVLAEGPEVARALYRREEMLPETRSALALPLQKGGQALGALLLQSDVPDAFPLARVELLQALADHLAAAVANAQTLASEAATLEVASPLFRATRDLSSAHTPEQIVETLHRTVLNGVDRIALHAAAEAPIGGGLPPLSVWDRDDLAIHLPCPTAFGTLARERALVIEGAAALEEIGYLRNYIEDTLKATALAVVPLVGQEQVAGYLVLASRRPLPDLVQAVQAVRALAGQIGALLENAERARRLEAAVDEATMLYGISLALNAAQDARETYETTLSSVASLSEAERITLYLAGPDPRGEVHYIEAAATWEDGRFRAEEKGLRYAPHEVPVISQFPQSRANLIFNDVANDPRLPADLREYFLRRGTSALTMIPLGTGAVWLGALLLEMGGGRAFDDEVMRLCRSVADQAAPAIDLQLILLRTRQAAEKEQLVSDITAQLQRAALVEDVLQTAARALHLSLADYEISVRLAPPSGRAAAEGNSETEAG